MQGDFSFNFLIIDDTRSIVPSVIERPLAKAMKWKRVIPG